MAHRTYAALRNICRIVSIILVLTMPIPSIYQRAIWVALVAAATPYAFYRLVRNPILPFDGALSFDDADLYDNLFDGELAAAG